MSSEVRSLPRKALYQKQRSGTPKLTQNFGDAVGFDKGDILNNKAKIQFEHDLETSVRSFERELHQQRLENLRQLADKLKEDAWKYPDVEHLLGM